MKEQIILNISDNQFKENNNNELDNLLKDFQVLLDIDTKKKYYDLFNIKELTMILKYYDFKITNKMKKDECIKQIVIFEYNKINFEIVKRRKELWYYIAELKKDSFMKKFILL